MIELPNLYDHQITHKDNVRAALAQHRAVIMHAPTGFGKTTVAKWILGTSANREPNGNQSGKMLFAVHRRGLVDNATGRFEEPPELPHGVIMSQRETALGHRVQVASIDTLLSWFCEKGRYNWDVTFDLIVFDETHSHFSKLQTFLAAHCMKRTEKELHPAYVLGLTATPDAKGLSDLYRQIVLGPPKQWLIEQGYLSPFRYFHATQGQLDRLVKRGGEFTKDSVFDAMQGLAGDLVGDWKRLAEGRPTVGFFPRLSQADEARDLLAAAGLKVDYVDGNTHDDVRRNMFWRLNNGHLDYICNVGVVERGTDIPAIGCIQLATAIGSRVRYEQMVGRGSRTHASKTDCLVLDHAANVARHGFWEDEYPWTLDRTSKDVKDWKAKPTIECPNCSAIYRGGTCRKCGYEPTPRERRAKGLEFIGGELREATKHDRKPKTRTNEQIMISALYIAGKRGGSWKSALAIAYGEARKQGTQFRVPKSITVGGRTYYAVRYGDKFNAARRVRDLYPFTRR